MRRLAECSPESSTEVRTRETGSAGQVVHVERLRIPRVDQVSGPQEVTLRGNERHAQSVSSPRDGVDVGRDRRDLLGREPDGHDAHEAGDVGDAQLLDGEVAARGARVVAGERVAAAAGAGEDRPPVCDSMPAAAAGEEERCGEPASACCRCGPASSAPAAAKRRGRAARNPPESARAVAQSASRSHRPHCCTGR
jgi:hypothetical protein